MTSADGATDPSTWTVEVDDACVELYVSLIDDPRPLTAAEAMQLVDLVDAWRRHEQRKHIRLMAALDELRGGRGSEGADGDVV